VAPSQVLMQFELLPFRTTLGPDEVSTTTRVGSGNGLRLLEH